MPLPSPGTAARSTRCSERSRSLPLLVPSAARPAAVTADGSAVASGAPRAVARGHVAVEHAAPSPCSTPRVARVTHIASAWKPQARCCVHHAAYCPRGTHLARAITCRHERTCSTAQAVPVVRTAPGHRVQNRPVACGHAGSSAPVPRRPGDALPERGTGLLRCASGRRRETHAAARILRDQVVANGLKDEDVIDPLVHIDFAGVKRSVVIQLRLALAGPSGQPQRRPGRLRRHLPLVRRRLHPSFYQFAHHDRYVMLPPSPTTPISRPTPPASPPATRHDAGDRRPAARPRRRTRGRHSPAPAAHCSGCLHPRPARLIAQSHSRPPTEAHTRSAQPTAWPSDTSDAPTVVSDALDAGERQKQFPHADADLPVVSDVSDASDAPLQHVSGVQHPAGVSTIPAASAPSSTPGQDGRPRDPASTLTSAPSRTCEQDGHRCLNPMSAPTSAPSRTHGQDNHRLDPAFALHTAPSRTHGQPGAHPTSAATTPQPLRPSDASDALPAISDARASGDRQKQFSHADKHFHRYPAGF